MRKGLPVPVPREHGAWAVLYASFLIGWAASFQGLDLPIGLLLISVTGLFLAHEPFVKLLRASRHGAPSQNLRHWRKWLAIYLTIGLLAGAVLLLVYRLWILLPFAFVAAGLFGLHLRLASERQDRSVAGELLGITGLTATAPLARIVETGDFEGTALLLWVTSLLYFSSGIFYVKMRVSRFLKPGDFQNRRNQSLVYHALLLLWIVGASVSLPVPFLVLFGFIPIVVRAFWHAIPREGKLNIRRIGYQEVFYTVIFTVCSSAGWVLSI